jgi:hypothetical protein
MLQRCNNPNNPKYHLYGGRGIKVCSRWKDYNNFLLDMGEVPDGLTLERKESDKDYKPGNCKWATVSEQNTNRGGYGSAGMKGISLHKKSGKYMAYKGSGKTRKYLGLFASRTEAKAAITRAEEQVVVSV